MGNLEALKAFKPENIKDWKEIHSIFSSRYKLLSQPVLMFFCAFLVNNYFMEISLANFSK